MAEIRHCNSTSRVLGGSVTTASIMIICAGIIYPDRSSSPLTSLVNHWPFLPVLLLLNLTLQLNLYSLLLTVEKANSLVFSFISHACQPGAYFYPPVLVFPSLLPILLSPV